MERVLDRPQLWVGDDNDYQVVKDKAGWGVLRCCKEGPGGHRETVGYKTLAAPKGDEYLSAVDGNRMALNFIDALDPNFVPVDMIRKGLSFIRKKLDEGDKVLVACNAGHSRGPTTAMLYLRSIGELQGNFSSSERIFRTLYSGYDPSIGVRQFARSHWDHFKAQ